MMPISFEITCKCKTENNLLTICQTKIGNRLNLNANKSLSAIYELNGNF